MYISKDTYLQKNNMKWKYINQDDTAEEQQEQATPQYIINAAPSSSGAVTRK